MKYYYTVFYQKYKAIYIYAYVQYTYIKEGFPQNLRLTWNEE